MSRFDMVFLSALSEFGIEIQFLSLNSIVETLFNVAGSIHVLAW